MPASTVHCTVKLRSDTAANWTSADPVLGQGEMGIEYDTFKFKIGNGTDCWNDITNPYLVNTGDIEIADKISHIGDTNTAIRFPANDTFTIETAGTEAFRVDSNQKILIGGPTTSYANASSGNFQVGVHTSATATGITIGGTSTNSISFADDGDDQAGLIKYTHSDNSLSFHTNGATNQRMTIDSSGNVGIGTSSPSRLLTVQSSGNANFCIKAANTGVSQCMFGDTDSDVIGNIAYRHDVNALTFEVNASERLRIDSSGNVKIIGTGTTATPKIALNASGAATFAGNIIHNNWDDNGTGGVRITSGTDSGAVQVKGNGNSSDVAFSVRSGGNSSTDNVAQINGDGSANFAGTLTVEENINGLKAISGSGSGSASVIRAYSDTLSSYTTNLNADGSAEFAGDVYADKQFRTRNGYGSADSAVLGVVVEGSGGAANATIGYDGSATFAGGSFSVASSGYLYLTNQIRVNRLASDGGSYILEGQNAGAQTSLITKTGSATFAGDVTIGKTTSGASDIGARFIKGSTTELLSLDCVGGGSSDVAYQINNNGSSTVQIKADGTAAFAGTVSAQGSVLTSDQRFKENITDAKSQLADVTALGNKLRNWDWTADAPVADKDTRFLGLVAQEAETICPGIVTTIARTKDGDELTPEVVVPAVYETKTVPAVLDEEGEIVEAETTEQVLVTAEQVTPATYKQLDDSYKGIKNDILIMKLLGAVAELSAEVAALKAG